MRVQSLSCYILTILILSGSYPVAAQSNDFGEPFIPEVLYDAEDIFRTNFSNPMSGGVSSPSGEFSFFSEPDALVLNWTHTSGTELEYRTVGYLTGCQEYAYFEQEFFWNRNVLPAASNLSLSFNITTTGTFHNYSAYSLFEICVWLVLPFGEWNDITRFNMHEDGFFDVYGKLGSWATDTVFQYLVSNETTSPARLVVGLRPTWRFQGDFQSDPWRSHNGSVSVQFHDASFSLLCRTDVEIPVTGEPLYQTTWANGYSINFQDSCTTSQGISYILTSETHEDMHTEVSVTKLDPTLQILWQKSWNDTSEYRWYRITDFSDGVYFFGTKWNTTSEHRNVCALALDSEGVVKWEREFNNDGFTYPLDLDVDNNDNVYLVYVRYISSSSHCMTKLDSNGNTLWRYDFGEDMWGSADGVDVSPEGIVYTLVEQQIIRWDTNGAQEWSIEGDFSTIHVLSDGSLLTVRNGPFGELDIVKFNDLGQEEWMKSITIEYEDGWHDYFGVAGIAETHDGTIFVLIGLYDLHPGRIIFEMTPDGTSIANYSIALSAVSYESFDIPQYVDIAFTDDNLLYLFGRTIAENWDYSIVVSAYGIEPFFFSTSNTALLGSAIAASIIVCTIALLQIKDRKKCVAE